MSRILSALALWILLAASAWAETVEGRVVDEAGKGVPDVEVASAWTSDAQGLRPLLAVRTDAEGRFRWPGESPAERLGLLAYTADRSRGGTATFDLANRSTPREVRLAPTVKVTGSIALVGRDSYPSGGFLWVAPRPRTACLLRVSPRDGAFEVPMPFGRYVISAQAPGRGRAAVTLDVEPSKGPLPLAPFRLGMEAHPPQTGDIPPPIEYEAGTLPELERRLEGRHFPAVWTLLYFWDHT